MGWYDRRTRRTRDLSCGDARIYLEFEVRRVQCKSCGKVKREQLAFHADNPFYTKRFAHYVGRRCRSSSIKDIAQELNLAWDTVTALEKQYMAVQLARAGAPGPKAIGIDEISIRKGHTYRIVVSDLLRGRPIWFGGEDRSEKSMAMFYDWLGEKKTKGMRLAVMDMWKPLWQRLAPYEKFAEMIDRHWDGIAAYCKPENKVSLGFVEGLNNKIRVIQRRAYGLRDEEYLRLKILTCMLPAL